MTGAPGSIWECVGCILFGRLSENLKHSGPGSRLVLKTKEVFGDARSILDHWDTCLLFCGGLGPGIWRRGAFKHAIGSRIRPNAVWDTKGPRRIACCVGTDRCASVIFTATHRTRGDFRDLPASSLGNTLGPCDDRSQHP